MAFTKQNGRQSKLTATATIDAADWAAAAAPVGFDLPYNAIVTGGEIIVETVFDSTTNTMSVGDSGSATRYASAVNLKAAARTALTLTGFRYTGSGGSVLLTYAMTGTAPTQGKAFINLEYIVVDRATEVQT